MVARGQASKLWFDAVKGTGFLGNKPPGLLEGPVVLALGGEASLPSGMCSAAPQGGSLPGTGAGRG